MSHNWLADFLVQERRISPVFFIAVLVLAGGVYGALGAAGSSVDQHALTAQAADTTKAKVEITSPKTCEAAIAELQTELRTIVGARPSFEFNRGRRIYDDKQDKVIGDKSVKSACVGAILNKKITSQAEIGDVKNYDCVGRSGYTYVASDGVVMWTKTAGYTDNEKGNPAVEKSQCQLTVCVNPAAFINTTAQNTYQCEKDPKPFSANGPITPGSASASAPPPSDNGWTKQAGGGYTCTDPSGCTQPPSCFAAGTCSVNGGSQADLQKQLNEAQLAETQSKHMRDLISNCVSTNTCTSEDFRDIATAEAQIKEQQAKQASIIDEIKKAGGVVPTANPGALVAPLPLLPDSFLNRWGGSPGSFPGLTPPTPATPPDTTGKEGANPGGAVLPNGSPTFGAGATPMFPSMAPGVTPGSEAKPGEFNVLPSADPKVTAAVTCAGGSFLDCANGRMWTGTLEPFDWSKAGPITLPPVIAQTPEELEHFKNNGWSCASRAGGDSLCTPPAPATPPAAPPSGPPAGPPVAPPAPPQGPPGQQPPPSQQPGLGGGMSGLASFLGGFAKGALGAASAQACPTDPNQYAQYQQQYNQQLQQYNQQLAQYNAYQQQLNGGGGGYTYGMTPYGPGYIGTGYSVGTGYSTASGVPTAPTPCTGTGGQGGTNGSGTQCPALSAQPSGASCPNGTWRQMTTAGTSGLVCPVWQCVPTAAVTPTAEISCQPKVADEGMSIAIAWSCENATGSTGGGFSSNNAVSGSATALVDPPGTETGANYAIRCTNQSLSASASCSVQIAKPKITLTAKPKIVTKGATSTVGWVTTGMQSCVVSSPEMNDFTEKNATRKSVNAVVVTPPITSDVNVVLDCVTLGGASKSATTSIMLSTSTPVKRSVQTSIENRTDVTLGSTAYIQWEFTGAPDTAAVALMLVNDKGAPIALIKGQRATSGFYRWDLPAPGTSCPQNSAAVCVSHLVSGRTYGIQAALYTPSNAYLGDGARSSPDPQFLGTVLTKPFTMR